jgi:hypothetical protein
MLGVHRRLRSILMALPCAGLILSGCGLQVTSPDLFVLKRTGPGRPVSLLVNDGGTIRCDGGRSQSLSDPLLIDARQLASDLDKDARAKLSLRSPADAVYRYVMTLQNGTIAFPDTAGKQHPELARAELFAVAAEQACRRTG